MKGIIVGRPRGAGSRWQTILVPASSRWTLIALRNHVGCVPSGTQPFTPSHPHLSQAILKVCSKFVHLILPHHLAFQQYRSPTVRLDVTGSPDRLLSANACRGVVTVFSSSPPTDPSRILRPSASHCDTPLLLASLNFQRVGPHVADASPRDHLKSGAYTDAQRRPSCSQVAASPLP